MNNLQEFMKLFDIIEYVSPDDDYDRFCELNIVNEKRKAMSMFLTNLMIEGVISRDQIIDIVTQIQEKISSFLDVEKKENHVEELTENNYIFITSGHHMLKSHEKWKTIIDTVTQYSKMKKDTHISISHKAIFKNMDILDLLKKRNNKFSKM